MHGFIFKFEFCLESKNGSHARFIHNQRLDDRISEYSFATLICTKQVKGVVSMMHWDKLNIALCSVKYCKIQMMPSTTFKPDNLVLKYLV